MRMVVQEIEEKKATLLLSVVTFIEVLDVAKSGNAAHEFRQFLKRSNVLLADVDPKVAVKAAEIREKAIKKSQKIKTPDAIIIATAIVHSANVLHSFNMQGLSGSQIVDGLKISQPLLISGQRGMSLEIDNNEGERQ